MPEILVHLSAPQRRDLIRSVPEHSEIWNALNRAIRPRVWTAAGDLTDYLVICDPANAEVLLHFARIDCPEAVAGIELAIREAML